MDWNERLAKWADAMERTAEKVSDFGAAEIPQYLRELLLWEVMFALTVVACMVFAVAVLAIIGRVLWGVSFRLYDPKGKDNDQFLCIRWMIAIVWGGGTVIAFVVAVYWGLHAAKCYYAPRVVIVEKVAAMAKEARK